MLQLRRYQVEACNAVIREWRDGKKKTLLILPTGCGKTIIFSKIAQYVAYQKCGDSYESNGKRVLILAHRNELLEQASDKFTTVSGMEVNREIGKKRISDHPDIPICVSSVQTMDRRMENYQPDYFDVLIVDEAHHTMSKQYQRVLEHFKDADVLGVTATPDRADGKKLETFNSIAYEYTIKQAMDEGYLCPMEVRQIPLNFDLSKIRMKKGDVDESAFGQALDGKLHEIAEKVRAIAKGRRTVCFVPLIATAQKAAKLFEHYGFRSEWVAGVDKERKRKLKAFQDGEIDILFNSMLLTEGWDCPETDCVIVLRPTTNRGLYVQMIGRGLRLAKGKENCLIVDFLYQNHKFKLASPDDVIGYNLPEKKGSGTGEEKPGGGDREASLLRRLRKATREQLERKEKLSSSLERKGYINPLEHPIYSKIIKRIEDNGLEDDLPTKNQEEFLKKRKINPHPLTYSEASVLIGYLKEIEPVTSKQRYALRRYGFSDDKIAEMNKVKAMAIIGSLKKRGVAYRQTH